MAAVYSTRFLAGSLPTSDPLEYTCPEGMVAVVVDISAAAVSSGAAVQALLNGIPFWYETFDGAAPGVSSSRQWRGREVLQPGDILSVQGTVGGGVVASGYLLTSP